MADENLTPEEDAAPDGGWRRRASWPAVASGVIAGTLPSLVVQAARLLRGRGRERPEPVGWTRQRLVALAREQLRDVQLVVVANREPYVHVYDGDRIRWTRPPGGVVTALDPVMQACGGTWIASGSGDADRETADPSGRLRVPPARPSYTLWRLYLSEDEESGYYGGFANQGLWPLCHVAYTRPIFDDQSWEQYKTVNERFAAAVLEEIGGRPAIVFVQDYHFALLPRLVKDRAPNAVVCQFWHIPWPNSEVFRICPWKEEILEGLLGNDLLGFHVQDHCNNFLETVERTLEARVSYEDFTVTRGGHPTLVRPYPISIDPEMPQLTARSEGNGSGVRWAPVRDLVLLAGVDRIDYTKGIPERLRAVDRLLVAHPEYRGRIAYVELGTPSRTAIASYRSLNEELDALINEINARHAFGDWWPIHFIRDVHSTDEIYALYRAAQVCIVSSLHDGMNLVAKEFVAARRDLRGVLVLSSFTGAARELGDALFVNPYATDHFADVLHRALTMPVAEQEHRMRRLRDRVLHDNVYRWAGRILSQASRLLQAPRWPDTRVSAPVAARRLGAAARAVVGRAAAPESAATAMSAETVLPTEGPPLA